MVEVVSCVEIPGFAPPRQRRSRATLERIVDAIRDLLLELEPGEVSVRQILERADTSTGAFYARFDDRDAALAYTSHTYWARSRDVWSEYLAPDEWERVPAASIVVTVIRTMTRTLLADAGQLRAFVRLALSLPRNGIVRRIGEHDDFIASKVAGLLAERALEIRHERPVEAAAEGFGHILSAVRDRVVYGGEEAGTRESCGLILSLCQMYGRYLDVYPVPRSYSDLLRLVRRRHSL